jgi:hypothetical protein
MFHSKRSLSTFACLNVWLIWRGSQSFLRRARFRSWLTMTPSSMTPWQSWSTQTSFVEVDFCLRIRRRALMLALWQLGNMRDCPGFALASRSRARSTLIAAPCLMTRLQSPARSSMFGSRSFRKAMAPISSGSSHWRIYALFPVCFASPPTWFPLIDGPWVWPGRGHCSGVPPSKSGWRRPIHCRRYVWMGIVISSSSVPKSIAYISEHMGPQTGTTNARGERDRMFMRHFRRLNNR